MVLIPIIFPLLSSFMFPPEIVTRWEQAQERQHIDEVKDSSIEKEDDIGHNCVSYIKSLGINVPLGDAKDQIPNSLPRVGGVVIMMYGDIGHLAYIKKIDKDGLHISESNFHRGLITERVISVLDPHIVGYAYWTTS